MDNGQGVPGSFPPLAKSDYLKNIDQSIHAIKFGLKALTKNGKSYNSNMTTLLPDDEEIADVMNYILRSCETKLMSLSQKIK